MYTPHIASHFSKLPFSFSHLQIFPFFILRFHYNPTSHQLNNPTPFTSNLLPNSNKNTPPFFILTFVSQFLVHCVIRFFSLFNALLPPLLLTMRVLPASLHNVAAGTFASDQDPPSFPQPSAHPIIKMVDGSEDVRKTQLLFSTFVDGVILVSNFKVFVLHAKRIAYDTTMDPQELDPLLIGFIGKTCATATPVSIDLKDALSDFIFCHSPQDPDSPFFQTGVQFDDTYFKDHNEPVDAAIARPLTGPVHSYRVPFVLPKLTGVTILEGALNNPRVLQSLEAYHPVAKLWGLFHKFSFQNRNRLPTRQALLDLDQDLVPPNPYHVSIRDSSKLVFQVLQEDSSPQSPFAVLAEALQSKIALNITEYKRLNPELTTPAQTPNTPLSPPLASNPVTQPQLEPFALDGVSIDGKYRRPLSTWRLFLAHISSESKIVLPTFTENFLEGYSQSTASENARFFQSALIEHNQERSHNTRDYLKKLISSFCWNNTTTALFCNAVLFDAQLDELSSVLKRSISFLTFLPTPHETSNPALLEFMELSNLEQLESIVGESNEKKRKINLDTFQGGLQSTPTHVLTGVANIESCFSFMINYKDLPLSRHPIIVQWLLNIADLYSSPDFVKFFEKNKSTSPWIPHCMVLQIQLLLSSVAKVAKSFSNLNLVKKNEEISPAAYKAPIKAYRDIIDDIHKVCHGSPTGTIFASAPPSFPKFVKRQKNDQTQSSSNFNDQHSSNNSNLERTNLRNKLKKKGWVISTGRYQWPSSLQCKTICNKFAQLHSACMDGTSCAYEHRSFPQDFSDPDRKAIFKFVQDHPALTFTPNITWCPPATPPK